MKRLNRLNPCELCLENPATYTCRLCGRRICSKCFDAQRGICKACAQTICEICGNRLSVSACNICGRLVCEKCSRQLTPVVRVCLDCLKAINEFQKASQEKIEKLGRLTLEFLKRVQRS